MTGLHLILDCRASRFLSNRQAVEDWLRHTASQTGMTIIGMQSHLLSSGLDSGPGVTAIAVIAESHMAVHTWPELGAITADFYSCRSYDAEQVFHSFCRYFGVTEVLTHQVFKRYGPE